MSIGMIGSTFGIVGSSLWIIPLLLGGITYYRYDRVDPESRPIDQPQVLPEYDFVGKKKKLKFDFSYPIFNLFLTVFLFCL